MLDIQTMFLCEQVADVAIWLLQEMSVVDILGMKHDSVSDEVVLRVYEGFMATDLPETEFIDQVYEQCVEDISKA